MTGTASKTCWELWLQGPVQLANERGTLRLERRTAALLAYLALEGPAPRSRLVGLLWPESPESTARANLRQLLLRLRRAAGIEVVAGKDVLSLTSAVEPVDRDALLGHGRPLDALEFADAEALDEWVERTRTALIDRRQRKLLRAHEERETAGDLVGALGIAREALELDPYSEEAHRRLMRAHALCGDRAAALTVYEACRAMLDQEFGVVPADETRALAQELSRTAPPKRSITPAPSRIPLAVLRPPLFAGREREWALMEEAWAAGRGILLCGAPGVGKTRLMQEFLTHKGGAIIFNARPGDTSVPYGTHARTYRELLEAVSPVKLPEWVRAELARIIPTLGTPAPPMKDVADKLRFFQAKLELHRIGHARGFDALGFDDLQFVDPASAEAGHYILSQLQLDRSVKVRTVHCYGAGTLSHELQARLVEAKMVDQFSLIELEPLAQPDVEALVHSLDLPELTGGEVKRLARSAGGNPAAALTAVKELLRNGAPIRRTAVAAPATARSATV